MSLIATFKSMEKNKNSRRKKDPRVAARVLNTATLAGVSTRSVQRIIKDEQENNKVLGIYIELIQRESLMIEEVKKLVPFL